jgi:AraC-like DNA-binding protein
MNFESVALKEGSIGRLRCPPQTTLSLPIDLASSTQQGVYVLCVLGGNVDVTHVGHRSVASGGDIVTFDAATAAGIKTNGQCLHDIVTLEVPIARMALRCTEDTNSLRLIRHTSARPLAGCMTLMAGHMHTASKEELAALYEACVSLLLTAESHFETVAMPEPAAALDNSFLRDILDYTDRNIADRTLGPPHVARRFGISIRYLHKLFAPSGVTFGSYVAMQRLDHVRNELVSGGMSPQSIAELAQKWGFRDISAFNRAFRKRFGCTPRRLRSRAAS